MSHIISTYAHTENIEEAERITVEQEGKNQAKKKENLSLTWHSYYMHFKEHPIPNEQE